MKKIRKEEFQSRREFFKDVTKKTLPILGAVVLANISLKALADPNANTSSGCNGTCSGLCEGCRSCEGTCSGLCEGCKSCEGTCSGLCEGCHGSCKGSCSGY